MSTTTSNGYKKPSTGDRGYFTDLEYDIDRINGHIHDGTDGQKISAINVLKLTTSILTTGWVAVSGQTGTYSQDIVVPTGVSMSIAIPRFIIVGGAEDGKQVWVSITTLTDTSYRVFINDNTLALKAIYG